MSARPVILVVDDDEELRGLLALVLGQEGFEVVLRRMETEGLKIPVVVLSGYSQEAGTQILRSEPAVVEFMAEPVKADELVAVIRRTLRL